MHPVQVYTRNALAKFAIWSGDPDELEVAVKTKAKTRKTNNQASFGGSLLKNNMEVEAAMEMQRHLDETGVHIVCTF